MEALFGSSKTPAEKMKEYQRSMKKSIREMDRERTGLERREKKLMTDIKKEAKAGRNDSAKIMARDLVRTRGYIKKMYKMKSHMEAISLRLTTMQSTQQMAQAMKGVTKVMGKMNAKMNIPQIQSIMMEFEKQNEVMGMKEEMMDDAMDDAIDPILSCTLASRIHSCEYDPLVRNITDSTLPENKTGRLGLGTHTERRSNLIKRQTLARDSRPPHVPRLRLLAVGLDAAFVARGGRRRRGSVGARTVEGDVEIRWRELCASGECHQTSGACATRRDATRRERCGGRRDDERMGRWGEARGF